MKIHSICLVKDEADIVGDVLKDALRWSDFIYIFDNGSTDGTTDIIKSLSKQHDNILFYKWLDRPFEDSIRSNVYHAYKDNAQKGDWWCRLDADEFYIDNPNDFLQNVGVDYNTVFNSSYNFYFTDKDLHEYELNPDSFSYKKLRYYQNNWSEIRFVKDNGHLYWPSSSSWPEINMRICPDKIRVRHYQYRGPQQIHKRLKNRQKAYQDSGKFRHDQKNIGYLDDSALLNAKKRIVSHKKLHYDKGNDSLIKNENVPMWKINRSMSVKIKIFLKNVLFRLNLLQSTYQLLGKNE